ncbi:MAG: hypothetical protein PVF70_05950 [Anaerolineales bacterium]|jgi:hypothetical protein
MERTFTAVKVMGTAYRILGGIVAVLTVIGAIGFCVMGYLGNTTLDIWLAILGFSGARIWSILAGLILGGLTLISGAALAVTFFGLADGVSLMLALEENTRVSAQLLHRQSGM